MECKLNIKAPNGKNSELFADLVDSTKSMNEAVNAYFWMQSDKFKRNYKGGLDSNGEPILADLTPNPVDYDFVKEYSKVELDGAAEVYNNLLDSIPRMVENVEERIAYSKRVGASEENIRKLYDLKEILEDEPINSSIFKFTQMAERHTSNLRRRALQFEKVAEEKDMTSADIMKSMDTYYKIANSYSVLTELKGVFLENPEVAELLSVDIAEINKVASNITTINAMYLAKAREYLADEFHKRDKSWSRAEILKELKEAPRDANLMQQMLEYMGDSHDKVLSMVGRIMMEAEHTKRREGLHFAQELQDRLENLERSTSLKGEDIFKEALLENMDGEIHVVDVYAKHTNGENSFVDQMAEKAELIKRTNQPLYEFLVFYNDTMRKLHAALPSNEGVGTRIPGVLRSEWELIQGKTPKEQYELISDKVKKRFLKSNLDMERGEVLDAHGKPLRKIPIFYNRKYDSIDKENFKKELLKEYLDQGIKPELAELQADRVAEAKATQKMNNLVSKDLAKSLQSYHTMAINYAAKNELIYIFEAAENVVGSDTRKYVKKDSAGVTLMDQNGRPQYVFGPNSKAFKQLQKFLDVQLYGQKEADLGFITIGGIKYDANSVLRALNSSTGYIMQAANVLAGFGNFFNGEYNNVMEGIGGEFYTVKDYAKASALYKEDIFNVMGDIGARTPSSFINLMEEHYNLLQSFGGNKLNTTERSKARRLMKTDSMYFIQASGEHFMQIRAGLAVLNKIEVFDKSGNSRGTLLDHHKAVNGKLEITPDLYVKERDGSLVQYDTIQQNRVADRIGAMLRKLHGNYSQNTANAAQQDARLALMLKFRGWMYEGVMRRWGKSREFHLLEGEREGFYRTGFKALWIMMKDLKKFQLSLSKEHWSSLTDHEKANIRRFVTETSAIFLTATAGALLGKAGKMVDDEFNGDDWTDRLGLGAYEMLLYQTNRLYTEIFAYLNPIEAVRLARTPMAASNIVENLISIMGEVAAIPMNGLERYEAGWRKDQIKLLVKLEKLIPIYKQIATLNAEGIKDRAAWLPQTQN